jgi:hypothetical protein
MARKMSVAFLMILTGILALNSFSQNAQDDMAIENMIRGDKFNYVLPKAMRNNNIDMWIIIDKGRGTEPLFRDLGFATSNGNGIFIFTDRGGKRIERAVLGGEPELLVESKTYDIFERISSLRSFVAERDPKRIGINVSTATELWPPEGRHLTDGLSHMDYMNLKKELGEPYASRLVSAEKLIADFRSERVAGEVIEFSKIANITRKLIERALSNEVITPGKTTMNEVCWWLEEQQQALGVERGWHPTVFLSPPDGNEIANTNRVIQPGDVLQIDVRANVRSGKTGREQLDNLKRLVAEAGFVYTEEERPSDVQGVEVNIGMHSAGNLGHDVGGSLFEIFPFRTTFKIRPNSLIAFEFIVFTPAEGWDGNKVPVCVEENALITERGIEWVHPPQERVLVIR